MSEIRFKCPKDLGITQEQFDELLNIRNGMARGEYAHAPAKDQCVGSYTVLEAGKRQFNMGSFRGFGRVRGSSLKCDTVCCIGGWMTQSGVSRDSNTMGVLFYPDRGGGSRNYNFYEPAHAVKAIDNFLQGSRKPWQGILT